MYNINEILKKSIIQMTGEEFCQLTRYANSGNESPSSLREKHYAYGVQELADNLGCCPTTIYAIKKAGMLDGAIVSRLGKRIIFDVDKAQQLAQEYQASRESEQ